MTYLTLKKQMLSKSLELQFILKLQQIKSFQLPPHSLGQQLQPLHLHIDIPGQSNQSKKIILILIPHKLFSPFPQLNYQPQMDHMHNIFHRCMLDKKI